MLATLGLSPGAPFPSRLPPRSAALQQRGAPFTPGAQRAAAVCEAGLSRRTAVLAATAAAAAQPLHSHKGGMVVAAQAAQLVISDVRPEGPYKIGYVSDVEGNLPYWQRFVDLSEVLRFKEGASREDPEDVELTGAEEGGSYFVFGGDCFDKKDGDLRIARQLVSLQRRHPGRVFLLLGNRDVNKLKLAAELDPADVYGRGLGDIPETYWLEGVSPASYLRAKFGEDGPLEHNTQVERLKFLLEKTMGCEGTFEWRRRELAHLAGGGAGGGAGDGAGGGGAVSDEEVVESFVASLRLGGAVREYVEAAQLGVVIGGTLYIHGAVTEASMGFVPTDNRDGPQEVTGVLEPNARGWVASLNSWARASVAEWAAAPGWDAARARRGGSELMGYCYDAAMQGRSGMIASYLVRGQPVPPPPPVVAYLRGGGVVRVVVGHKPVGECPLPFRGGGGEVEVVMADTSYSDASYQAIGGDRRGAVAVSEVLVVGRGDPGGADRSAVRVHGVMADGAGVDATLTTLAAALPAPGGPPLEREPVAEGGGGGPLPLGPGDPLVGQEAGGGWWVVGTLTDTGQYLLRRAEGYKTHYCSEPRGAVLARRAVRGE